MEEKVRDANALESPQAAKPVETPALDMSAILAQATPEDIAQAQAIMEKLGIKG